MATNTYFDRAREERNNQSFFKMCHSVNVSSEDMRALPYDFARSFSDKELSCKMKIRTQWGSSWEVAISKNPRFYFMEKSGWEKFVKDNALGHSEFLTFTHKGNMCFTVNIFKQDGNEMLQPSQSRASLASSSSFKIEQEEDEKKGEEVVVSSSELSNCVPTKAAESNGRKLKFGKKLAEESQNSKKAEKLVCAERGSAGFTIIMKNSDFLEFLPIPRPVSKYYYMPKEKAMLKIHHPDGKRSWDVTYLWKQKSSNDFSGWRSLCKEYPLAVGHTCIFTLIKPNELLLVVSKD